MSSLISAFELPDLPLVSLSPGDINFDKRRRDADKISKLIWNAEEIITPRWVNRPASSAGDLALRIKNCAQNLIFKQSPTGLKLHSAKFCRVRCCPICQWRRSLIWQAKSLEILPKVVEHYPDAHYLFLTLTVKNCSIYNLRTTLNRMQFGWQKLMGLKNYKPKIATLGHIKSFEVTIGENKTAHPHYHALLMMPSDYYQGNYIHHSEIVQMWRNCCGLNYLPSVRVMAIDNPASKICEVIKYCVKPSDLGRSRSWLIEYNRQVYNFRAIEKAGIFRQYFKELSDNPVDLININEDKSKSLGSGFPDLFFAFDSRIKRYVYLPETS